MLEIKPFTLGSLALATHCSAYLLACIILGAVKNRTRTKSVAKKRS